MSVSCAKTKPAETIPLQGTYSAAARHHKKFHQCDCYGHSQRLPNYKMLAQPRTNNYYSATGGCPCIPRAAAHPGSWRLKSEQIRSATHARSVGCRKTRPGLTCCVHAGETYGWKSGPHNVLAKNTAASGLCDTFGNMAFKRSTRVRDNESDVSSVCTNKLEDLESLILQEHKARQNVEMDIEELKEIQLKGTKDTFKLDYENEKKRQMEATASQEQLDNLLREVRSIVKRPLNQTNMDILRRIVDHQERLMELRKLKANEDYPQVIYP